MTSSRRRRGRRRWWRAPALITALLLLLAAVAVAAVHLPAVQRSLLARGAAALEARTGLRLTAESMRLRPLGIRLELARPALSVGAAEPFLTARAVTVELAPLSLLRGPPRLREVELLEPRLDAARPLPEASSEPSGGPAELPALTVESFRLRGGTAEGLALPEALRGEAATLAGLEVDGTLIDGRLDLALRLSRIEVAPVGRPALAGSLEGRVEGPLSGPLRATGRLDSAGVLALEAAAILGLADDQPRTVDFTLEAVPEGLLGGASAGGAASEPVRLGGRIDLRTVSGEARLEAPSLAGELAAGGLDPEVARRLALPGSSFRAAAELSLRNGALSAEAEASWRRGGTVVAETRLAATAGAAAEDLAVDLELALLPAERGSRELTARLVLPRDSPADGRVERGRTRLVLPDLESSLARARAIWPELVPLLPAGLAAGPLDLEGEFSGAFARLAARLAGEWRPAPGASLRLRADAVPVEGVFDARMTADGVPLSRFVDGATGVLGGNAALRRAAGPLTGELRLEAVDAGAGPSVERLALVARLEDRRVEVESLTARAGDRELTAAGEIDLGTVPAAELELRLAGGWGPMEAAEGRLRLADGVLALDAPRLLVAGAEAALSLTAPLGTLARLPGAEALAELPLGAAEGPLEVRWRLPVIDWAALAAWPAAPPEGRRWLAGTRGELALLPAAPAASIGEVEIIDLQLEQDGHVVRAVAPLAASLSGGRLWLSPSTVLIDGRPVELSVEAELDPAWSPARPPAQLLRQARLGARLEAADPVAALELDLLLREGRLDLALVALFSGGERGRVRAGAPLATLIGEEAGLVDLSWEIPAVDWSAALAMTEDAESSLTALVAGTTGALRLDPRRPGLAAGELRIPRLEAELDGRPLRAREPIVLRLADGRLEIVAAKLLAAGSPLDLAGRIELETGWAPGRPATELVRELSLTGGGVVPAALLNPFLAGGAGEGALVLEMEIGGRGAAIDGKLRLDGPGAVFYFVSPYPFEISAPGVVVHLVDGAASFEGGARVNEGRLDFSGRAAAESGLAVEAKLDGIRAVLDYGLLALLDGDLRFDMDPDGSGLLAGRVIVDRAQLTRPVRLDRLLLEQLLPADLLGTELDPLESIALDLRLETREGVRVRNNLADLKVRWEPILVRGDLVRPTIEGRLETDPGGLVFAYGQTVRLDSAAVVYRGLPDETPELELQTTTSLEDPSIGRLAGRDAFAESRAEPGPQGGGEPDSAGGGRAGQALTTGVGSFLGEQFNESVGQALGGAQISFRPLVIFGETDPGARLTATRELTAFATLAASVDLRNAERQTYLLDLHDESAAARLGAQLFSNDLGNEGGTLQQRFELGGSQPQEYGPRLRGLRIDRVPGVKRRVLRRAAGYRKGDRLVEGAGFEIGVAVGEALRGRGYPDARVRVLETPAARRQGVELEVVIDSGPRVEFRFTGEKLPKPLRQAVAELYRGDFYEPTAIEEMRAEAIRAWRSRGFLDPQVTIERELLVAGPPEVRRVTVDSRPGERLDLAPPRFAGLPPEESRELASLFTGTLWRVELAAGLEAAERRALQGLAALGYADAAIVDRRLSPDRRVLTVEVEPGERLRVAALELLDAEGRRVEVGEAGGVAVGDPLRANRLGRAALEVERQLRDAGYLDARVTLRVEPLEGEPTNARRVVFELDRGPIFRLAATDFRGLGATRPKWARREAGLTEGEPLAPADLREARRRLYATGLFSAVGSEVGEPAEDGARVLFEVAEKPRYRVAYGLRWESQEGTSLVVDLLDRNFAGRGIDLGLRTLWSDEESEVRLSGSIPGILGPRSSLELFAVAIDEERLVEDGEILDETRTVEGTVQLSWRFGQRTTGRVYGRYRDVRFTETFLVEDPFFGPIDPIQISLQQPFLGLQYIFDDRDDPVAPERGLFASIDLSFSDESLGGDIRYGRLFGQVNSFRPAGRLAGRRLTWGQSVRLGRAEAFGGQELLGDLLLRAGGEYSVRGYARESLGPPELIGTVLPSVEVNSLLVINEELRFEIRDIFSGVVFLDAGNIWIDDDLDFELFTSTGLGVRADTPFGLLRLDFAWPLDRREGVDPGFKIYFGLGNVF